MTDLEKVIKGLEGVLEWLSEGEDRKCVAAYRAVEDALELLREQEAVRPIENAGFYYCGACKYAFTSGRQKFCSDCGRKVKWDAVD